MPRCILETAQNQTHEFCKTKTPSIRRKILPCIDRHRLEKAWCSFHINVGQNGSLKIKFLVLANSALFGIQKKN